MPQSNEPMHKSSKLRTGSASFRCWGKRMPDREVGPATALNDNGDARHSSEHSVQAVFDCRTLVFGIGSFWKAKRESVKSESGLPWPQGSFGSVLRAFASHPCARLDER